MDCASGCGGKRVAVACAHCNNALYCNQACADVHFPIHQHVCNDTIENEELLTEYGANETGGVMFFITDRDMKHIVLGRELGGAYAGLYNMFGGQHDKTRLRMETALAEYCEEFGASLYGPGTECGQKPTYRQVLDADKVTVNGTIVIHWLLDKLPDVDKWNANNALVRANKSVSRSYKEMDQIRIFDACTPLPADIVSSFAIHAQLIFVPTLAVVKIDAKITINDISTTFKSRGFYKASKAKLAQLRKQDMWTWLCIQSYVTMSLVNPILHQVKGDWSKFDQTFFGIPRTVKHIKNPLDIFSVWFEPALVQGARIGRPLKDPAGKTVITTKEQLFRYYPMLRAKIDMADKAAFMRAYVNAIQRALVGGPKLTVPITSYRGYTPINLPNTLTLDIDRLHVGQVITNWSFMSVSLNSATSASFVRPGSSCCMLVVIVPKDFPAFMVTSHRGDTSFPVGIVPFEQSEVLLPAGVQVRVEKKYPTVTMPKEGPPKGTITVRMAQVRVIGMAKIKT